MISLSIGIIFLALGQIGMLARIEKLEEKTRRMSGGAENEN